MLVFLVHACFSPLYSSENLGLKVKVKMFTCLLMAAGLLWYEPAAFVPPIPGTPDPVRLVVKYIVASLFVDILLFSMYLALGYGQSKTATKQKSD
ncbi:hypothetical protein DIPPA_09766 [Diplonema papillatum]|nr:hypothetical protein DIPPA_09766 [Diplonema papillatum]